MTGTSSRAGRGVGKVPIFTQGRASSACPGRCRMQELHCRLGMQHWEAAAALQPCRDRAGQMCLGTAYKDCQPCKQSVSRGINSNKDTARNQQHSRSSRWVTPQGHCPAHGLVCVQQGWGRQECPGCQGHQGHQGHWECPGPQGHQEFMGSWAHRT